MDEVAFVDASPLILLAPAGKVDLLRCAARRVVLPSAAHEEILARGEADPTVVAIRCATWIELGGGGSMPDRLRTWDLGDGESAVLALASQTKGAIAVIDDLAARTCAAELGVKVLGTLGLVIRAKRLGLIVAARPVMLELRAGGMHLSDRVLDRALREVGE